MTTGAQRGWAARRRIAIAAVAAAASLAVLIASGVASWSLATAWDARTTIDLGSAVDSAAEAPVVAFVATDRRPDASAPPDVQNSFGDRRTVDGARADVIVLVRTGREPAALQVPRDLLIAPPDRTGRLGVRWVAGPTAFTDAVCGALGIRVDHVIALDPTGYAAAVDALGGLAITSDGVLRDRRSGLRPTTDGPQTLDGAQALAWVRARHLERWQDGRWVRVSEGSTSLDRSARATDVLTGTVGRWATRPWASRDVADAVGSHLTTDTGLDRTTAASAVRTLATTPIVDLDVTATDGPVPVARATDAGRAQVASFADATGSTDACPADLERTLP